MGIFTRMTNMFKAKVNATLDDMEDPIELLDQKIKDMTEQLNNAKINSANIIGNSKLTAKKLEDAKAISMDYEAKIKLALSKNNEDLAKRALSKKLDSDKKIESLTTSYETSKIQANSIKKNLTALQSELNNTISHRDELAARYANAKASREINEVLTNVQTESNSIQMDSIERKIAREESLANGLEDLKDIDTLDEEFNKLNEIDLDTELAKYKSDK